MAESNKVVLDTTKEDLDLTNKFSEMGLTAQEIAGAIEKAHNIQSSASEIDRISNANVIDLLDKLNGINNTAIAIDDAVLLKNKAWRSNTSIPTIEDTAKKAANAILKIVGYGFSQAEIASNDFRVGALSRKDGTYGLMVTIYDNNEYYSYFITQSGIYPPNSLMGPLWYKTVPKNNKYFDLLIDFSLLEDGFKFQSTIKYLRLDKTIFSNEAPGKVLEIKALISSSDLYKGIINNASYSFFKNFSTISSDANVELIKKAIKKVKAFGFTTEDKLSEIKLVILCKNDASLLDRIWIFKDGVSFLSFNGTITDKSGYVWVTLGNSTKYIKILIDYSILPTGIVLNNGNATNPLIFNPLIYEDELIENRITANTNNISTLMQQEKEIANSNLRVSVAGSSITWGSGWLGQGSYVEKIEDYLLNVLANTKTYSSFTFTGTASEVSNELFYKGKASLLTGLNSEASITMYSDEFSICIAKERGNNGASLVELYVDNVLHDTFSTENNTLITGKNKTFVATGVDYKYNLEEANTFNHVLTVNGVSKVVQMNTQGYGATFPAGVDALIIRAIVTIDGIPKVNHVLWFKVPPLNGDSISLTYSCGENICYTKSTITQTGISLNSANESTYGDGAISFDTTKPSSISSGLDFRETNQDSILTYKFAESKSRIFKLRIKSLSTNGSGTPKLYLNFVTDRIHFIQNAGIGGWTASALLSSTGLNTLEHIKDFKPDIFILESCTNDDWSVNEHKAYKTIMGLTDAAVRGVETSLYYNSVSLLSANNYTVEDVRINILVAARNSITIDSASATLNIATGDILNMGRYNQDSESIITRIVKTYNSTTKVITFDTPLTPKEIAKLSNSYTIIRGLTAWETTISAIIDGLRSSNQNIKIGLGTSGNSHFYHRRLNGYTELAKNIALNKNVSFIDFWRETYLCEKTQRRDKKLYLNASSSSASTGGAVYTLYTNLGSSPTDYFLRNLSVKVNGVERLGSGCFVTGGKTYSWAVATTNMTTTNKVLVQKDFKLEFTNDTPQSGAVIDISYSSGSWSSDNTHPDDYGKYIFSKAINSFIRKMY